MFSLKPVTGKDFINRKSLLQEMVNELSDVNSTMGFALYGNRRVGKTSVLKEVQRRLNSRDSCVCIYFSLWELVPSSVNAFIKMFSRSVIEGFREELPLKYKVSEMAKMPVTVLRDMFREVKLGAKISDEIELFLKFKGTKGDEYSIMLRRTLELPDKLAEVSDVKCILLIDEFPTIIDLKNGKRIGKDVLGLIRTVHEEYKRTAICISGSIRKTIESSVLVPTSPFYRQFITKEIMPFEKEDVEELLRKNLAEHGIKISKDGMAYLYEQTAGIPFYVQFLGRRLLSVKGGIDKNLVRKITSEFLVEEGNVIFAGEFKALSPKEKKIVISIACGNQIPSEISKSTGESANTISRFLIYLLEKGVVEKKEKSYLLADPVFQKWVHGKYRDLLI